MGQLVPLQLGIPLPAEQLEEVKTGLKWDDIKWWGCTRWIQLTHSLKAPGFNPCWAYEVKTRFQSLLSNATCTATVWGSASVDVAGAEVNVVRLHFLSRT
jgi:hypothetical protein